MTSCLPLDSLLERARQLGPGLGEGALPAAAPPLLIPGLWDPDFSLSFPHFHAFLCFSRLPHCCFSYLFTHLASLFSSLFFPLLPLPFSSVLFPIFFFSFLSFYFLPPFLIYFSSSFLFLLVASRRGFSNSHSFSAFSTRIFLLFSFFKTFLPGFTHFCILQNTYCLWCKLPPLRPTPPPTLSVLGPFTNSLVPFSCVRTGTIKYYVRFCGMCEIASKMRISLFSSFSFHYILLC